MSKERTVFGKIIKWSFIIFNALMLFWFIAGMVSIANVTNTSMSEAERGGAAVGTVIGAGIIFFFWAAGDIILGLFVLLTRPSD